MHCLSHTPIYIGITLFSTQENTVGVTSNGSALEYQQGHEAYATDLSTEELIISPQKITKPDPSSLHTDQLHWTVNCCTMD